jgi:hypothetical protein
VLPKQTSTPVGGELDEHDEELRDCATDEINSFFDITTVKVSPIKKRGVLASE